jgi:type IV pilus assembly protein PilF
MRTLRTAVMMLSALSLAACMSTAERRAEHERNTKLSDTHLQLGVSYLQRGQLEVAKENLEKAVELNPESSPANNMLALLQWRLKQYAQAEAYFRKALQIDNANSETWNNYGVFLCERGQYEGAEQAFNRALSDPLYKTPAEANVNAGMCQMRKPSPVAAEKYFRAALALNARQPRALIEMARLSLDTGRSLSARAFLQRYFESNGDTPETLLLATKIEGTLGNRDAEASYAVRLRGKYPESVEATQLKTEKAPLPRSSSKVQR